MLWSALVYSFGCSAFLRRTVVRQSSRRTTGRSPFTALLTLVGFLSAVPSTAIANQAGWFELPNLAGNGFDGSDWVLALFQHGLLNTTQWSGIPVLATPLAALCIVGLGAVARHIKTPLQGWLAAGLFTFGLLFFFTADSDSMALFFLLCATTATVALQMLLGTFAQSWRPLVRFSSAVAISGAVLLVLAFGPLRSTGFQREAMRSTTQIAIDQAITEEIARLWEQAPDLVVFAPQSLLDNPGSRLRLGDDALTRIRPLSDALNTVYTMEQPHDTVYMIPLDQQPYVDLIQRIQPQAIADYQLESDQGELLYTVLRITAAEQYARQGLLGTAWESDSNRNGTPTLLPPTGALSFDTSDTSLDLALHAPFTIQWSGALRIGMPGSYRFQLDSEFSNDRLVTQDATVPLLTMQLDNRLILDSSLGLTTQELALVKGFYQVTIRYQSGESATGAAENTSPLRPFALRWQRPDGQEEVIPQSVLYNVPLPNVGLIGAYYWGNDLNTWDGEPFDLRKDLVVGLAAERNEAYRVRWRGQLAAPRTGEYLLATLSAPDSSTALYVDGIQLFDSTLRQMQDDGEGTSTGNYVEGTIYLTRGWHELDLHYVPDPIAPTLQLFWQPPGSDPSPLDSNYLAPVLIPLLENDRMVPAGPPLVNGAVDSGFALSFGTEFWQPQSQIPPGSLPFLPLEALWQSGSCGTADDQLAQPHGVALSPVWRLLYVADTANRRVIEYTWEGTINRIYQDATWEEPFDVALIDGGFPVVLDATTQQLYNLNPVTGAVEPRPLATSFYHPRGFAVDELGNLLVADTGGGRISQVGPGGDELGVVGGQGTQLGRGQPTDVVGVNGLRWAITAEDGRLWQLDSGGSLSAIERTNTLNGPHLAALADGRLFVSDPTRRLVLYLAATGQPLAQFSAPTITMPTGVGAAMIDEWLYLAIVDTANCQLSLWRTAPETLPAPR
ncbi:MAG: hypothetical protein R2932_09025 [Caldilineaceae bacterium]